VAARRCLEPVENVAEFLGQAVQGLLEAADAPRVEQGAAIDRLVAQESQTIEEVFYRRREPGLAVGYRELQRLFSWPPGGLAVLAARPGLGKTTLAANFVWRLARAGVKSEFFTLEMSKEQLVRRFMALVGQLDGQRLNQGRLTAAEWTRFGALRVQFEALPIWIDDTPGLSVADIRIRARRRHRAEQRSPAPPQKLLFMFYGCLAHEQLSQTTCLAPTLPRFRMALTLCFRRKRFFKDRLVPMYQRPSWR